MAPINLQEKKYYGSQWVVVLPKWGWVIGWTIPFIIVVAATRFFMYYFNSVQ